MQAHFLQSKDWKRFQEALGRKTFEQSGKGWQWLAVLETGRFSRLYCPYGPTAQDGPALAEAITALYEQAKQLGVHFVRIEPIVPTLSVADVTSQLQNLGAHRASHNIQPQHTWHIDLTQSAEAIVAEFTGTNRRLWLRGKDKLGITFRVSHNPADMDIFLQCIKEVADRTGIRPHSDDYFRLQAKTLMPTKAATLIITEVHGVPAATVFVFDSPTTRVYAHAAAHYEFHKLAVSTAALSFAIMQARELGKEVYDMHGVAPTGSGPSHPWSGFTRFKKSFGGYAVNYAGTWELPVKPHHYRAYKAVSHTLSAKRKFTHTVKAWHKRVTKTKR